MLDGTDQQFGAVLRVRRVELDPAALGREGLAGLRAHEGRYLHVRVAGERDHGVPAATGGEDHHRVGALAVGRAGVELLLLLGGHAFTAVRADDQVGRAVALFGPVYDLGEVDLTAHLGVGPEVRAYGDAEHRDDHDDRADLETASPVGRRTAVRGRLTVPAGATVTALATVTAAGRRTVDLARVVAAVVRGAVLVVPLRRLLWDGSSLHMTHHACALGLGAPAAASVSIGPIIHAEQCAGPDRAADRAGDESHRGCCEPDAMHRRPGPRIGWRA